MPTLIEPWLEWKRLCEDLHIDETNTKIGFAQLAVRYGEAHRKYHTIMHIKDCLERFALLRDQCEHPLAVELALWWHDEFYNITRRGNEAQSAKDMVEFSTKAGVKRDVIDIAHACVIVTKHDVPPKTRDEEVMIDVDLSILGQPWSVYEHYTQDIRKEYAHVPGILYCIRRRYVMERFLETRPYIFYTAFMREHFEKQARRNITQELHIMNLSDLF